MLNVVDVIPTERAQAGFRWQGEGRYAKETAALIPGDALTSPHPDVAPPPPLGTTD